MCVCKFKINDNLLKGNSHGAKVKRIRQKLRATEMQPP